MRDIESYVVEAVRERPDFYTAQALVQQTCEALGLHPGVIRRVVENGPTRFRKGPQGLLSLPKPRSIPTAPKSTGRQLTTEERWAKLALAVAKSLTTQDSGTFRLRIYADETYTGVPFCRFRIDLVGDVRHAHTHITTVARDHDTAHLLTAWLPLRLTARQWRLRVPPASPEAVPTLMVAVCEDATEAAGHLVRCLRDGLGISPRQVALEPAADVARLGRLIRSARRHRDAPGGQCIECSRPLSDPESIRIGIGPECFRKLHPTARTVVSADVIPEELFFGAVSREVWPEQVLSWASGEALR